MNYNPYSLEGKTILITGASSGIGRTTAIECSKMGAKCVVTGRNEERLQETFDQLEGDGHLQIIADLSTQEGIDILVSKVPFLDGVVNNAGIGKNKLVSFIKQEDLSSVFQTNTFAPIMVIKALLKTKKLKEGCSLTFTSSIASLSSDLSNGIYGASKAALSAYVRYCARELADKKIRANAVLPGMIETKLIHDGAYSEDDLEQDRQRYPLKRYGRPEDVAWAIIYLLSDASAWVTGTSVVVDGGILLV